MNLKRAYEMLKRRYFKWLCQRSTHGPNWNGRIGIVEAVLWLFVMGLVSYAALSIVIKSPVWLPALVWYAIRHPDGVLKSTAIVAAIYGAAAIVVSALHWLNDRWIIHECDLKGRDATVAEIPAFLRRGGELEPPPGGKALGEAVGVRQEGS